MRRRGLQLARAAPDTRHRCKPPSFIFRGPSDGTRWTCAKCGREWVWAAAFPRSLGEDILGRSSWHNVEYETAFVAYMWSHDFTLNAPDADDFGGRGPSTLPLFGSPDDGKSRKWWEEQEAGPGVSQ